MVKSKLIDSMIKAQQIVSAIPKAVPVLSREGLINGKYSWAFDMPVIITFRAGSVKRSMTKTVHLVVEQVSTRDNPSGVGIGEWYMD
jgi:hypothetical protein